MPVPSSPKPVCPDDGACHHECAAACWRVRTCGPLSGVFPGDEWPQEIVELHADGDGKIRTEDLLLGGR